MMLMFSLIILTGISLPWQAFLLFNFCNSLSIFFVSITLKENDRLFYPSFPLFWECLGDFHTFTCTENWISNIGIGYIIPKIIMLRLGTILLKNVLNVSVSSTLFVIVLLLSFNFFVYYRDFLLRSFFQVSICFEVLTFSQWLSSGF